MEYAIQFAETGHLVLCTLHANSANQALDRIINFFPDERREQLLMDLSLNMRAFVSQRLIPRESGSGRIAATEIMLNSPLIQDLIFKGEVPRSRRSWRAPPGWACVPSTSRCLSCMKAGMSPTRTRCATPIPRMS